MERVLRAAAVLGHQIDDFERALRLFEFLQGHLHAFNHIGPEDDAESCMRVSWLLVPAKQATLTVWHFKKALDEFREAVNAHPKIRLLADTQRIKRAIEVTFKSQFPHWQQMRCGVAHSAERVARYAGHAAPGPLLFGGLQITQPLLAEAMMGNTYRATIDGRECSCEVSKTSYDVLVTVANECRSALEKE